MVISKESRSFLKISGGHGGLGPRLTDKDYRKVWNSSNIFVLESHITVDLCSENPQNIYRKIGLSAVESKGFLESNASSIRGTLTLPNLALNRFLESNASSIRGILT